MGNSGHHLTHGRKPAHMGQLGRRAAQLLLGRLALGDVVLGRNLIGYSPLLVRKGAYACQAGKLSAVLSLVTDFTTPNSCLLDQIDNNPRQFRGFLWRPGVQDGNVFSYHKQNGDLVTFNNEELKNIQLEYIETTETMLAFLKNYLFKQKK